MKRTAPARETFGIDFGLSVTDAVLIGGEGAAPRHAHLLRPGAASEELLIRALAAVSEGSAAHFGELPAREPAALVGVTGGRSKELSGPPGIDLIHVSEPSAVGRGGLALADVGRALVVSCGTGTSMVGANREANDYTHVSGTAVGGGTLEGLAAHLLGVSSASEVAELALRGDAGGVDTTLGEVLGGGVGELPPAATAVNLGRLRAVRSPAPEDLAAGLVTMVGQTVALVALNAARANGFKEVVMVGRLAGFAAVRSVMESVFALYGADAPLFPEGGAYATALGAALGALSRVEG